MRLLAMNVVLVVEQVNFANFKVKVSIFEPMGAY